MMKSLYAASHLGGADKASDAFCWYESSIATSNKMPTIEKNREKGSRKEVKGAHVRIDGENGDAMRFLGKTRLCD